MGRKKENKFLYWAGMAALAYLVFQQVGGFVASKISFAVPQVKKKSLTPVGLQVEVTQPVTNNLPVSFPIDQIQGAILYGERQLSSMMSDSSTVLEANSTTNLKLNMDINFQNLASNVVDLIVGGEYLQGVYLKGFVMSDGVMYPFKNKITLT